MCSPQTLDRCVFCALQTGETAGGGRISKDRSFLGGGGMMGVGIWSVENIGQWNNSIYSDTNPNVIGWNLHHASWGIKAKPLETLNM